MGEYKFNPVIKYLEENPGVSISRDQRAWMHKKAHEKAIKDYFEKHPKKQVNQKGCKRKLKATPIKLPGGKYIVKHTDPISCPRCGEILLAAGRR